MRRYQLFLILTIGVFIYLGLRLSPGLGWPVWLILFYIFLGVLFYPLKWLRKSSMNQIQHLWRLKAYMDLGLLCFLLSLVVLRDVLYLPLQFFSQERADALMSPQGSAFVIGLSLVFLVIGVWAARSGPRIKKVKIPLYDLPKDLEGFRIVQISDLHVGPTIGTRYAQKVVRIANSLKPDLTVLTGDIVDGDIEHHEDSVQPLGELKATHGAIMVTGNHEYYWNGPAWIKIFENLGIPVLCNAHRILQHQSSQILIAGILDPAVVLADPQARPDLKATLNDALPTPVKVLLAHQPDIAYEAEAMGFDLLLSGHTHGGQIFPLTLFIHSLQKFVKGLKYTGKMWVYVNQGTGYWGPPIRFGTITEITQLELTSRKRHS